MLSDRRCNIIEGQTQSLGFDYELLQFLLEQVAALGGSRAHALRHYCADSGMNFEYAFRHQVRDHLMSCIGIDLQSLAEFSHGRKHVADAHLAGDHGLLSGIHDLLVKRDTWFERYTEWNHSCLITASTPFFK
jgi:hypothetical protein